MREARKGRAGTRRRPAVARAGAAPRRARRPDGVLRARDLMTRKPVTVLASVTVGELCEILQLHNINGVPVVDGEGSLLGVVSQDDIIYGAMGHVALPAGRPAGPPDGAKRPRRKGLMAMLRERGLAELPPTGPRPGERPFWADPRPADPLQVPVSAIMTSPAIAANESTTVAELCRIMWNLRIHRVPILRRGKVTGLVSSMDLCRAVLSGRIRV